MPWKTRPPNWTSAGFLVLILATIWWIAVDLGERRLEGYACAVVMTLLLGSLILEAVGVVEIKHRKWK
jgi:hypothetical protein